MEEFVTIAGLKLLQLIRRHILVKTIGDVFFFCLVIWIMDTVMGDLLMLNHWFIYTLLFCIRVHFSHTIIEYIFENMKKLWFLKMSFKCLLFLALYFLLGVVFLLWIDTPSDKFVEFIKRHLEMNDNFNISYIMSLFNTSNVNATFTEMIMKKYQIYVKPY